MNRRRVSKVVWWLLPLFALRGLVPAGFMLSTVDGELSMIVCHGAAKHGSADGQSRHDARSICAYAVAPGAAPMASLLPVHFAADVEGTHEQVEYATADIPFGPARAQQSRAPPVLS